MSELDSLRDRIAQLEQILGIDRSATGRLKDAFGISPALASMLGILMARSLVSGEAFYTALYGARPECDWPDEKIIDVQICKLRAAIKPHGIEIGTKWGEGWYITQSNKTKARAVIASAPDPLPLVLESA